MDNSAFAYFQSALKLGLPVEENTTLHGFHLNLGNHRYYFRSTTTPINNGISSLIAADKNMTHRLLTDEGIPVPKSVLIDAKGFDLEHLIEATSNLKFPVVLKPYSWTCFGLNVTCNIPDLKTLEQECIRLFELYSGYDGLQIEEFHGGLNSFRVLVYKNRILDVVARFPARVIGNGKDSLVTLVTAENKKRLKKTDYYRAIKFDTEAEICLKTQGLTKDYIPKKGEKVQLGYTTNASRGGTIRNLPTTMCKANKDLFIKTAKVLGLNLVGIDVECKTLKQPIIHTGGVIIETNYNPSMRIHEEGVGGPTKHVTKTIMKYFIYKHPLSYFFNLFRIQKFRLYFSAVITISFALIFILAVYGGLLGNSWITP